MFETLRALFSRRSPASPRTRRCRPQVEALEERAVPTVEYTLPGGGFGAIEGQPVTGELCNFSYLNLYLDSRPTTNYQATILYGDGTPPESGTIQELDGYYDIYANGHVYSHWTDDQLGYPTHAVDVYFTDLNPVAGEDPTIHWHGSVSVANVRPFVNTQTVYGVEGQSFSGQVATVRVPNADKITGTLQATVVWNDQDVTSTANGRAYVRSLGGDFFGVYVSGHTFQKYNQLAPGSSYILPYVGPYSGFTVYASTKVPGVNDPGTGYGSGAAGVDMVGEPDTLPSDQPAAPPAPPAPAPRAAAVPHRPHHASRHPAHHPAHHARRLDAGRGEFLFKGSDGSSFDQHGRVIHRVDRGRGEILSIGSNGSVFDQHGHRANASSPLHHARRVVKQILDLANPEAQQNAADLNNALGDFLSPFQP